MAITKKTLFADNLDKYNTFVTDTDPLSKYFKLTELPDTFTGGKNAFLIQGSEYLVADSLIKIELKDAKGDVIYHEPGEGIISASVNGEPIVTEYYEGVSKLVSVYIYPDTAYGPCTLTILGELSSYDNNGTDIPIPANWEGSYNVKWQKQINVVPSLANNTKIRFYKRPTVKITEILSPIYSIVGDTKIASAVTQSFADIKLSNLETFAGDVKRVKVFRTSIGDISDYDLIQDILVESKELLTSYGLSGSVVGNTGIFTAEVLKNQWNSGSLTAILDSSRVEAGVRLTGNGNFRYTQSLDLSSANTYELNLDAFYSSSTNSNLGIYLVSGSTSSSIATLSGTQPTKNLLDTTIPFKVDRDYPTASLYFSQSQGQWHLGNVSLKLSEDTAFSPDEISFITTMPTVLGNETFNFKFEFYDVNNNYVPVAVTQSALFNGGNTNIGGTILLISSSASSSLADLNRVSSSISGTVTFTSSSISGTLGTVSSSVSGSIYSLSGSVSGTIGTLSGSVSQSVALTLSSSLSKVKELADGNYSGVFIDGTTVYAPVIGGTTGYIKDLFTVGSSAYPQINLDARTSTRKIYIGTGTYSSTDTPIYLDSSGKFSLLNKLTWNGSDALTVNGTINATAGTFSGNITSTATISGGTISGGTISGGTISIGSGNSIFKADTNGIYLGNATFGSAPFRVSPSGELTATNASISGTITVTGGNAETTSGAQSKADSARDSAVSTASGDATTKSNNAYNNAVAAAAGDATTKSDAARNAAISAASSDATTKSNAAFNSAAAQVKSLADGGYAGAFISSTTIYAPVIGGTVGYFSEQFRVGNAGIVLDGTNKRIYIGSGTYGNSNTGFYADSAGNFSLGDKLSFNGSTLAINGNITATGGSFSGPVTAGNVTIKSDGIKLSGDTNGIEIDGGRGIFSDNGGRITLAGGGYFFCNNGINSTGVYPGVISINNSNVGGTTLQISNYGGSSTIFSVGSDTSDGVYIEDTSFEFRKASAQTYLNWRAVFLEPVSTGTVSMQVDSSGYIKKASSSRRFKKNIEDTTLDAANRILNLNVRSFNGLNQEDGDYKAIGLVAEEVQDLGYDDLVVMGESGSVESVYYQSIFASMIKVVQNLNSRIEELEAKLSGSV
jgi:hypothetical protein